MSLNDYLVGIRWHDVIIVGAGHNGLVAALFLARKGLKVLVLEERDVIGGATRTERPFAKAAELGGVDRGRPSSGSCPPSSSRRSGSSSRSFGATPTRSSRPTGERFVTFGSSDREADATREQLVRSFSDADWKAHEAMHSELAALRDDVAPTWLRAPLSIEETAETVRPEATPARVHRALSQAGGRLSRALGIPERSPSRDVRRDREPRWQRRSVDHPRERNELPRREHEPAAERDQRRGGR